MDNGIQCVLLDLGGVLVELNPDAASGSWFNPNLGSEENWREWLQSKDSQAFERGEVSPYDFAQRLIKRHSLTRTPVEVIDSFRSWVIGFYPEVFPLLDNISASVNLAVFSNITEIHWPPLLKELQDKTRIRHYFASYLIGKAKPDVQAFIFVCNQMQFDPERVLFVDDNPLNISGAQQAGLDAVLVRGPVELGEVLLEYGLLVDVG